MSLQRRTRCVGSLSGMGRMAGSDPADLFLKGSAAAAPVQSETIKSIKNMVIAEALKLGGHHF